MARASEEAPRAVGAAKKADMAPAPSPVAFMPSPSVKAGEWDDNANYREFQRWLGVEQQQPFHRADVSNRQFIVVRDAEGKAMPRCEVQIADEYGRVVKLTTTASGRALLFPHAEGLRGGELTAATICQNGSARARISLAQGDGVVDLKLAVKRVLPQTRDVDVAFILDTTGSMSEEIAAVKVTLQKVAASLSTANVRVRIGLVEYKDRTDPFVTKVYPMTTDVAAFARQVSNISASGGGDTPESVNEGLHVGLTGLRWSDSAVARFAFLIGDAPPHLDYANDFDYAKEMRDAAHKGIQVFTVAASGMDELGQVVFRQIAQYTQATNLFVLRGGAGPQSTGAGDPKSSCGGTQTNYASGNLDALIVQKLTREIKNLDRDPLRIPGQFTDENAKPCKDRLMVAE
jgi:Mg-chelatase subunit ChlD